MDEAPAIVDRLLHDAIRRQASDMYWLPDAEGVDVRVRVDGRQETVERIPHELAEKCLTHVKVLAGVLTYRTKTAQDGVIRYDRHGLHAELRTATMPTHFGERIALRMQEQRSRPMRLPDLGFPEPVAAALRRMTLRPHGLVVLTGPTGCGKTTTIYAMLRELLHENQDPASIISIEDPIEQLIPGISQSAVSRESDGWTYHAALRAALRQDVKTLSVGEMRDAGVVNVVLDAALTGHRIFTTYHAGDVASVYARLLHLEFEPFLVAAAITGVVSQRLVPDVAGRLIPVVAILEPDDAWRDFIAGAPPLADVRCQLARYPLASLAAAASELFSAGRITRETWLRIKEDAP